MLYKKTAYYLNYMPCTSTMNNEEIDDVLYLSLHFPYGASTDVGHVPRLPFSLTLTAAGSEEKFVVTQEEMDF